MSEIDDMRRLLVRAKTRITALEAQVADARHELSMATKRPAPPDAALPPLPEGWMHYQHPDIDDPRKSEWESWGYLGADGLGETTVTMRADGVWLESDGDGDPFNPADLILVLRHAQAAQQRLAQDGK